MMIIVMIENCFCKIVGQQQTVRSYVQPKSLPPIRSIVHLPHTQTWQTTSIYSSNIKRSSKKLKISIVANSILQYRNIPAKWHVCTRQVESGTAQDLHRSSGSHWMKLQISDNPSRETEKFFSEFNISNVEMKIYLMMQLD